MNTDKTKIKYINEKNIKYTNYFKHKLSPTNSQKQITLLQALYLYV